MCSALGEAPKGREAEGEMHERVNRGTFGAKCQNLAQEQAHEELGRGKRGAPGEPREHPRGFRGGGQREREAGWWGHPKVHSGAVCAKCQNLARERSQEKVEGGTEMDSCTLERVTHERTGATECGGKLV